MKYRFCSLFFLLILLGGCATTQVHLVTDGIEKSTVSDLTKRLQDMGYVVHHSDVVVPKDFPNSVLAMNPGFSRFSDVAKIQQALSDFKLLPAMEKRFGQGKHFYNDDNVGLYLRGDLVDVNAKMPAYLRTQYCKLADATLEFKKDGVYILETEAETEDDYELERSQGRWFFDGTQLTLVDAASGQTTLFKRFHEEVETYLGPQPAEVFRPTLPHNDVAALNCHFIIIHMQDAQTNS